MLRLELNKMQKAIERAKAEHLKVRIVDAAKREYAVGVYTVRFVVNGRNKFSECDCKGARAGYICKHVAAAAQANIMVQSTREEADRMDFMARNIGWMV
jgi:uncharacterized Zn finger protein